MEAQVGQLGEDVGKISSAAVEAWFRELLSQIGWTGASRLVRQALVFGVVAGVYFSYFRFAYNERQFYYDSIHYWTLAKSFSLAAYKDELRGYAFPFLCLALRRLSLRLGTDEFVTFWVASALGMATLGTIIVPTLVRKVLPRLRFDGWSVITFNALFFCFFRGYATFPLTDIPAAALLSISFLCALAGLRWSVIGGIAFALAVSFRPIYLLGGPGVALLFGLRVVGAFRARQVRTAFVCVLLPLFGFGLGMAPQLYVNHHSFKRLALLPPTDMKLKKSLYLAQLEWGITLQGVNGSVGKVYPRTMIAFHDKTGMRITEASKNAALNSYRDWLGLFSSYPRSMVSIYSRHLFNGLDVVHVAPYIKDPYQRPILRQLANYSLWFIFLSTFGTLRMVRGNWSLVGVLLGLLLPVAAVIPTAIEVRFFLPLYLVMYATLAFGGRLNPSRLRRASIGVVACFVLFQLACLTLSETTFSSIEFPGAPS
jgi:hypothetical protein